MNEPEGLPFVSPGQEVKGNFPNYAQQKKKKIDLLLIPYSMKIYKKSLTLDILILA